jgi:hypothetical protein
MTTGGAPAHAGLAVGRGRECGRSLLVTPRRGGLRARQAHSAALRCQGGTRQQSRDNDAQHKTHDAAPFSVFTLTHKGMFRMQRRRGRSSTHHVGVMKAINRQRSGVMAWPIAITFSVAIDQQPLYAVRTNRSDGDRACRRRSASNWSACRPYRPDDPD